MRIAAVFLLMIAFVLDVFAGAVYVMVGIMGAEMLLMVGMLMGHLVTLVQGETDQVAAQIMSLGNSFGTMMAAAGMLVVIAGFLALIAGIQLLRRRPGRWVYIGCVTAIIADTAPLVLLGFNYFQLPGFMGGLLGMLAARQLDGGGIDVGTWDTPAVTFTSAPPAGAASRAGLLAPVGALLVGIALVAQAAYFKFSDSSVDAAPAPQRQASVKVSVPGSRPSQDASSPARPAPEAHLISGPLKGMLAGLPFEPKSVRVERQTVTTYGGTGSIDWDKPKRGHKLVLALEVSNDFKIEIHELPKEYDFAEGLELHITENSREFGDPSMHLITPKPGRSFGKTDFAQSGYNLLLKLNAIEGNRINGLIYLSLPESKKTQVSGTFKAWVDGFPDIEPDLTRGGPATFQYLVYQQLKSAHPGSEIPIKDHAASYQLGDASKSLTGSMKVMWTVDGSETAGIFRMATNEGRWRVVDSLSATQIPDAHPIDPPEPSNEYKWVYYLAAQRTEQWFQEAHPGKYPWSVSHTGTVNQNLGYADIRMSVRPHGETKPITRRYYYRRDNGEWAYVRDLKKEEKIDRKTGELISNS